MKRFADVLDGLMRAPERDVLRFEGRRFSARETTETATRVARALLALGVRKGDRVALWLPNRPEWIFLEAASALIGAVLVPVNTRYQSGELLDILHQSETSVLFLQDEFLGRSFTDRLVELVPEIRAGGGGRVATEQLPALRVVVCLGRRSSPFLGWEEFLELADTVPPAMVREAIAAVQPEDPGFCIYTGGTTGRPKGALLTQAAAVTTECEVGAIAAMSPDDRVLYGAPLTSVFGCCNALLASWTHGACLVLLETFDAAASLEAIERDRCTVIYGVPTMFIMQLEHPRLAVTDCSSLRTGLIGGAPSPPDLVRAVRERMHVRDLLSGYGMTETCAVSTIARIGDPPEVIAETVGRPLPGIEVKIVDPQTAGQVPGGGEGEICVRGYNVMREYFKNPAETARALDAAGWLHTGDVGRLRADGNLVITGRTTDMFITGGFNVHPAEVESVLFAHPAVKQAYVVGVPDHRMGEVGAAFVELKEGMTTTGAELAAFCRDTIAGYKVPKEFRFITDLPMTPLGKVQKFRLRELATRSEPQRGE